MAFSQPTSQPASQASRLLATPYIKTINDLYIKTKSNARKSHKNKNHTDTHTGTARDNGKTDTGTRDRDETTAGDAKREFCEFY